MSKWGVPHGAPDIGPNQSSPLLAFSGLVQKCRSSTLHSIIPFHERKKGYSTYSSRNKIFFMAIYNQTSLEKTRVPIDLKGEKS
jgi:hypothetical protein